MKKPLEDWGVKHIEALKIKDGQALFKVKGSFGQSFILRVLDKHLTQNELWKALTQYQLPYIANVLALSSTEKSLLILEEYIKGCPLSQELNNSSLDIKTMMLSLIGIVENLAILYKQSGILHLDIKPENILMDSTGRLTLIDFGAACCQSNTVNFIHHRQFGTLEYLAPERTLEPNRIGPMSDLYSIVLTLKKWMNTQGNHNYKLWSGLTEWENRNWKSLETEDLWESYNKRNSDLYHEFSDFLILHLIEQV